MSPFARLALGALLAAATASAQRTDGAAARGAGPGVTVDPRAEARVEVRVDCAADPGARGPAAWTALRDGPLAAIAPRARAVGLLRTGDPPGPWRARGAPAELAADVYLRATLLVDGDAVVDGALGFDGVARYRVAAGAAPRLPAALRWLAAVYGPTAAHGFVTIDLPALLDHLGPAEAMAPPALDPLALEAATLEGVTLLARDGADGGTALVVTGPGGLLLPALAAWARAGSAPRPLPDPVERLGWLAATTCGAEREEAARQLAATDDPRSRERLEALSWAGGRLGDTAVLGLAWRGSAASLPMLEAAARDPRRRDLARLAIAALAPTATTTTTGGSLAATAQRAERAAHPLGAAAGAPRWRTALAIGLGAFALALGIAIVTLVPRRPDPR